MKHIRSTFFLLTTLFIMASCGEDRSGEYYALVGENLWIEQIMKEHYSGNKGNGLFCRTGKLPAKIGLYQGTKRKRRPVFVYRNKRNFRCGPFLPATYFYLRI